MAQIKVKPEETPAQEPVEAPVEKKPEVPAKKPKEKEQKLNKIKFFNKFDKNHNIIYPTGAFGRINVAGQVVINLHSLLPVDPISEIFPVDNEQKISGKAIEQEFEEKFDSKKGVFPCYKLIQSTMLVSPPDAMNIAFLMIGKALESSSYKFDKEKLKKEVEKTIEEAKKDEGQ